MSVWRHWLWSRLPLLERLSVDHGKNSKLSFTTWACAQISTNCRHWRMHCQGDDDLGAVHHEDHSTGTLRAQNGQRLYFSSMSIFQQMWTSKGLCRRSNVWRNESKATNSRCHQANLLAVGPWLNIAQSSTVMVQILAPSARHSMLLTRMDSATVRCGLHLLQSLFSVSLLGSLDSSGLWISPPTCWSCHSFLVASRHPHVGVATLS